MKMGPWSCASVRIIAACQGKGESVGQATTNIRIRLMRISENGGTNNEAEGGGDVCVCVCVLGQRRTNSSRL